MVNIISTPCCNTVFFYKLLKEINYKFLLKIGKPRCVCVFECSSCAPCRMAIGMCLTSFEFYLFSQFMNQHCITTGDTSDINYQVVLPK